MIVYFANRKMEILGQASTNLPKGIVIKEDNKVEEIDVGVATFECRITYSDETRATAEQWTEAGNYILRSNDDEKEFYTIINTEIDTKERDIYIYAEDAGMDLLNEILKASDENAAEQTCTEYVETAIYDSGFQIGINESDDSVKKLLKFDEQTASERILDIMKEFELEVSYSFDIERLTVTNKYINIHKKRGKDTGVQLRDGRELDGITIKKTVENLATALLCTGSEDASGVKISLQDYEYDDGDFYVEGHYLKSRNALAKWSRYVNPNEPNKIDNVGHIVQTFTYDTVDQKELCEQAIKELKKKCDIERNYEIEITHLPEGIKIGDIVNVVGDSGELYLQSRLLKLETSVVDNTQTATLGDYLIRSSGISEKVEELASQFKNFTDSQTYYTWIAYADDSFGNGISLDPDGKTWVGFAGNQRVEIPDISNPEIYKWSKFQGEPGVRAVSITNQYYLSSSDQEPKDGEWSDMPLEWIEGKYLWKRNKITWSDETVTYTDPELDAALNQANKNANDAEIKRVSGDLSKFKTGEFEDLKSDVANFKDTTTEKLNAAEAKINVLDGDYAKLNTLVNGNLTSANIQNLTLTSQNTTIENGMIKNAMIENLSFDKITGIDINTSNLMIHSEDGKSQWSDNTIQISDANRVRVQIGKDASNDYSMSVWDASGNLIWDALGATDKTIQRKIIRDNIVADDANISGSKLDINSVIKEVNGSTTKLKSSTIVMNDKNQTLDVVFNEMETTVADNLSSAKLYSDSKLSDAQKYALEQANSALSSAKNYADSAVDNIEVGGRNLLVQKNITQGYLSTDGKGSFVGSGGGDQTSDWIDVSGNKYITITLYEDFTNTNNSGRYCEYDADKNCINTVGYNPRQKSSIIIELKSNTKYIRVTAIECKTRRYKIEKGNKATDWTPAPEDTQSQIDNITEITTSHTTSISTMQGQISSLISEDTTIKENYDALLSRYNATVNTVDSMKTTIGEHTTILNSQNDSIVAVTTKANTIESNLVGTTQTVSEVKSNLAGTQERVTKVETSLTGLTTRVSNTETDLANLEIGGRNLLLNSDKEYIMGFGIPNTTWTDGYAYIGLPTSRMYDEILPQNNGVVLHPEAGKTYTQTIWIETDANIIDLNAAKVSWYTGKYGHVPVAAKIIKLADNSYKLTSTYTVTKEDSDIRLFDILHLSSALDILNSGTYLKFGKRKVEQGNVSTDWTPAPEDVDQQITAVETIANQNADRFKWLVKSGTSSTDFELTDRTATLIASAINMDGLVTFSGLNTDLQNTINNKTNVSYLNLSSAGNTQACWKIATIKISGYYTNQDIIIGVNHRNHGYTECRIQFMNADNPDPGLASFRQTGQPSKCWRIIKTTTSTWDLYLYKSEAWDGGRVVKYINPYDNGLISVTWSGENADLPSGTIAAEQMIADQTTIDGSIITTGKVNADRIDVTGIFAKDVTATGTITGVKLSGATGTFSGSITATSGTFTNVDITGKLTATGGQIGKFIIDGKDSYLKAGSGTTAAGMSGNQAFWAGGDDSNSAPFRVGYNGQLVSSGATLENANVTGVITATKGTLRNCTFDNGDDSIGLSIYTFNNTWMLRSNAPEGWAYFSPSGICIKSAAQGIIYAGLSEAGVTENGKLISTIYAAKSHGHWYLTAGDYRVGIGSSTARFCTYNADNNNTANKTLNLGSASALWKRVYAANASISTSDRRLKEDIKTQDSRYEKLFDNLKPVSYKWKGEGHDRVHTGFIAQDVKKAMDIANLSSTDFAAFCYDDFTKDPEWTPAQTDHMTDQYSLAYEEFISLNTHMIQKTRKQMSYESGRIDMQEAIINDLQTRLLQAEKTIKQLTQALA